METILFEDGNHPGILYRGTRAHLEGLLFDGGSPIERVEVREGETVTEAPPHWVETWERTLDEGKVDSTTILFIDDATCTVAELVAANTECPVPSEELAKIRRLDVGEKITLGGGAMAGTFICRVG